MAFLKINVVPEIKEPDCQVVEFDGEIDKSTIEYVISELTSAVQECTHHAMLFDLSGLTFINSEGIGLLTALDMKLVKKEKVLLLASPKPNVADVMKLIGLHKLIPTFSDIPEALSYLKKHK